MIQGSTLTELAFIDACANGNAAAVRNFLIKEEGDPAADDNAAIYFAAYFGQIEVVKLLLGDSRVNPADENSTAPIAIAAEHGFTEIVKFLLLDKRVDPSTDDNHAIWYAVKNGHTDVVKLLLADSRIDPNSELEHDNPPIVEASINGFPEIVKFLLLDKRVNPAAGDNAAIKNVAKIGNLDVLLLLLEHLAVLTYVRENLIDFITNNKHIKYALDSSHNNYNEAFRNTFFSLISKEFFSGIPYYIAALHANGIPNDLIVHNIAPVLHRFFAYYLNSVMSNDTKDKVSADGIHLVNQSCMLFITHVSSRSYSG